MANNEVACSKSCLHHLSGISGFIPNCYEANIGRTATPDLFLKRGEKEALARVVPILRGDLSNKAALSCCTLFIAVVAYWKQKGAGQNGAWLPGI